MPRPQTDYVHNYFSYDAEKDISQCKICGAKLRSKHSSNLKNHMSVKHLDKYQAVHAQNILNNQHTNKKDEILKKIQKNCIALVTLHGYPFSLINKVEFQNILEVVGLNGAKLLNTDNIQSTVALIANKMRKKIAEEIEKTIINLKLDYILENDRIVCCISLQYIKNKNMIVRTLGIIEFNEDPGAEDVTAAIVKICSFFDIGLDQVNCIVFDYANDFKQINAIESCTDETAKYINYKFHLIQDDDLNLKTESYEELADKICSYFSEGVDTKPKIMFCVAQSIQLAVKEAIIKNEEIKVVLKLAREVIKILLTSKIPNEFGSPFLDDPRNWMSTFLMIQRLLAMQALCESNSAVNDILPEGYFKVLTNILVCLQPIMEITQMFQNQNFTIGDFFVSWLTCKTNIEAIHSEFASDLMTVMKTIEARFLKEEMVLQALYLDGRLNVLLCDEASENAQTLLCETYSKLKSKQPETDETMNDVQKPTNEYVPILNDSFSALEKLLSQAEQERKLSAKGSFHFDLRELRNNPRLSLHENILEHWNLKALASSRLAVVAATVLATPATHFTLKTFFSALKFIENLKKDNLAYDLIQDTILVNCNKDLYDSLWLEE